MLKPDTPIKQKLTKIILFTCCVVLFATSGAFVAYELLRFRQALADHLSTVGKMIANNCNAALAFQNQKDATETLSALVLEPHIVAACLYGTNNLVFATYPTNAAPGLFPKAPATGGQYFEHSHLIAFEPVMRGGQRVGMLYLNSDMGALFQRIIPYGTIAVFVMIGSLALAYGLSEFLQRQISGPVLALAETAKAISQRHDYSVRAPRQGKNEFGLLTDVFNNMLEQIHDRDLELQEAQQKLRQHAEELERRVAERTARLSETVAELESFSYSVSHDMRAPLRAMQGYAAFVQDKYGKEIGPEGVTYLERISRAGNRLDTLIQDILTYSRLSRAQLDLHPLDLEKLVEDAIHQYPGLQAPQADIAVSRPLDPVIGHEAALTQVIANLLGNAVKFMPPGQKPVVRVFTERKGEEVRLWVEDNGIGIAAKDLSRIFGIFERIHPDKRYEGTGIGLSIVRKGMERMGGRAGVESELGKGSRFWIQLPRAWKPT
jgi:signal transduction histidine kinase